MKPSECVINRIKEEVQIKNLCIEKNIITKDWAKKELYWETRGNTGSPHPEYKERYDIKEWYKVWHHGSSDYWGEWDEYPFTESLQCVLASDVQEDDFDGEDPPFLERHELIDLLKNMNSLETPLYGSQP